MKRRSRSQGRKAPAPYTKYHKVPIKYSQAYYDWRRTIVRKHKKED